RVEGSLLTWHTHNMPPRAAYIFAVVMRLAVAIAALLLRKDEPRYKGRTLEQWIKVNSQRPDDPEAREAIVIITTNSLSLLVARLASDTSWGSRLEAKLPGFLRTNTIITPLIYRQRFHTAYSMRAF